MGGITDTVLVVDDNPTLLRLVQRQLRDRPVTVDTAESGTAALELISEHTPMIAFVDVNLGDDCENGICLVEKIRQQDTSLPLCMLTGDKSSDTLLECLIAGANDFIWKGSVNPTAAEAISVTVDRLQDPHAPKGDPILDNSILKSRGLRESHLRLLAFYSEQNFPDLDVLSSMTGLGAEVLTSRFYRIRTLLGIAEHEDLVRLLRVARGYTGRMSSPPPLP